MEETLETIAVMRIQEEVVYTKADWLQRQLYGSPSSPSSLLLCKGPLHCTWVDFDCREKMASWYLQVADVFKLNSDTAEIALSLLDRFVATAMGVTARVDRNVYRLASMVAFYTAVKIHESKSMDPNLVSRLSQGAYSPKEIETMEAKMLSALQWRVNPPTAVAFADKLLDIIPDNVMSKDMRKIVYDVAVFQTKTTFGRRELLTIPASVVAYAAIINSLESMGFEENTIFYCRDLLSHALRIDSGADSVGEIQRLMYEAVVQEPTRDVAVAGKNQSRSAGEQTACRFSVEGSSPRSIVKS